MRNVIDSCATRYSLVTPALRAASKMKAVITRRTLLAGTAATAGGIAMHPGWSRASTPAAAPPTGWFRHGVASGDPLPDAVVLWTRVTPTDEATPGSGQGPPVTVHWEIALDAGCEQVVAYGDVTTGAERDHTVKVEAGGLSPGRRYFYRFTAGGQTSPIGRTKTAPAPGQPVAELKLAIASCANWEAGYFAAYRHIAARHNLDAVLHLGDYIYEYGTGQYARRGDVIRPHQPAHPCVSLADYRLRYGTYRSDPDLQAAHAAAPWIVTWDDHEIADDCWRKGAKNHHPEFQGSFTDRAHAARRAFDEWLPCRISGTAQPGDGEQLYRRFDFGSLANLTMLDLRSYRSQQADSFASLDIGSPQRTITGKDQMRFLIDACDTPGPTWRLVGNPVMLTPVTFANIPRELVRAVDEFAQTSLGDGVAYNIDTWDGYPADRRQVLHHIAHHGIKNAVFLTGDIHSSWACEVPLDAGTYPHSRSVAVELVGSSITSDNLDDALHAQPRTVSVAVENTLRTINPHIKALDLDSHGYLVLTVQSNQLQADWYALDDKTRRTSNEYWLMGFIVKDGSPHLMSAHRSAD